MQLERRLPDPIAELEHLFNRRIHGGPFLIPLCEFCAFLWPSFPVFRFEFRAIG
jgi:hypothetical protein